MDNFVVGDLRIEIDPFEKGRTAPLQLQWRGKSNNRDPSKVLAPFFSNVFADASSRQVPVELHFEKLDHFNSSTITAIIQLIQEARGRGIKLVIVYDHALKWQKLSFDALRVFARDELLEFRPT